jgi:hypothetical protein
MPEAQALLELADWCERQVLELAPKIEEEKLTRPGKAVVDEFKNRLKRLGLVAEADSINVARCKSARGAIKLLITYWIQELRLRAGDSGRQAGKTTGQRASENYISAADAVRLFPNEFTDTNAVKRYAQSRSIPMQKPSKQRLEVNLVAFARALAADKEQAERSDHEPEQDIFQRYAKLRAEKDQKAGTK